MTEVELFISFKDINKGHLSKRYDIYFFSPMELVLPAIADH